MTFSCTSNIFCTIRSTNRQLFEKYDIFTLNIWPSRKYLAFYSTHDKKFGAKIVAEKNINKPTLFTLW